MLWSVGPAGPHDDVVDSVLAQHWPTVCPRAAPRSCPVLGTAPPSVNPRVWWRPGSHAPAVAGAGCRAAWAASYSAGGTWPISPCSRRWLNQSMYSTLLMPRQGPRLADQFGLEQARSGSSATRWPPPGRPARRPTGRSRCAPTRRSTTTRWSLRPTGGPLLDHRPGGPCGPSRHRGDRRGRVDPDPLSGRDLEGGRAALDLRRRGRRNRVHRVHLPPQGRARDRPADRPAGQTAEPRVGAARADRTVRGVPASRRLHRLTPVDAGRRGRPPRPRHRRAGHRRAQGRAAGPPALGKVHRERRLAGLRGHRVSTSPAPPVPWPGRSTPRPERRRSARSSSPSRPGSPPPPDNYACTCRRTGPGRPATSSCPPPPSAHRARSRPDHPAQHRAQGTTDVEKPDRPATTARPPPGTIPPIRITSLRMPIGGSTLRRGTCSRRRRPLRRTLAGAG
ncbi:hypothetical protein SAMN05661080_00728 [Modestobacter sp. DSM 44400]|nr:hypothetical protein SAMN05661080_00728 [Modestobacter sp. DSM 44400]